MSSRRRLLGLTLFASLGCGQSGSGPEPGAADARAVVVDATPVPPFPSEIDGRLTINELMAGNVVTTVAADGAAGAWVEVYNPTDTDVPLGGYALTDDLDAPAQSVLPNGVVASAGGHLLLWADGQPARGREHVATRLTLDGGTIALARPDGTFIDRVTYGAQEIDFSAAREPDGAATWAIEWHASPAAANPDGDGPAAAIEDPATPPEEAPAAGDLSERLLGYDVVPEIALSVSPEGVLALEAEPYTYVPATITYLGRSYGPVGLRVKGANSFQPFSRKPSLKIDVNAYVPGARFFGQKALTLNNMDDDPSMMHERLAYYVAREAGVVASRSNHALVTVNGAAYGLYAQVEPVKRQLLERWFADATGPLFEATDVDFAPEFVARYDLETGPDDRTLIAGLADALTITSPDAAITAASSFVNLPQFQRYWAMTAVIGQFDAFPYSFPGDDYHLYADPESDRLWFIPWGMDETFFSASYDVGQVQSVLARTCVASAACFQAYVDQAWEILALTETLDLVGERARVAAQIAPYVAADLRKPYTTADVADAQAAQGWFILERRMWLAQMLPPPTP